MDMLGPPFINSVLAAATRQAHLAERTVLGCKLDLENNMSKSLTVATCWPHCCYPVLRLCLTSLAEQHRPGSVQQAGSAAACDTIQLCCMITPSRT